MSVSGQTDLLKLSRERLKQLCKERGHTGYSKCTKPQLVALLGSDAPSKFNSSMMTTALPPKQDASSSASVPKKRPEPGFSGTGESVAKKQKRLNPIPSNGSPSMQTSIVSAPSKAQQKPLFSQKLPTLRELPVLPASTTSGTVPLPDRQPILPPMPRLLPSSFMDHSLSHPQRPEPTNKSWVAPNPQSHNRVAEKPESGTSQQLSDRNGRTQAFKKFADPRNSVTISNPPPCVPQESPPSAIVESSSNMSVEPLPSPYLDFSVLPVPVLGLIGIPPSISDRKKVHSWSIILSRISNTERRACILVSRMFRYAGKSAPRSLSLGISSLCLDSLSVRYGYPLLYVPWETTGQRGTRLFTFDVQLLAVSEGSGDRTRGTKTPISTIFPPSFLRDFRTH